MKIIEDRKIGFFKRLSAAGHVLRYGIASRNPKQGDLRRMIGTSAAGIVVNESTAMNLSAVYAAVRLLSELVASLPLEVIEEKDGKRMPLELHPVKSLLQRPRTWMDRFTFDEYTEGLVQLWGNSVSLIKRNQRQEAVELIPVHTKYVTAVMVDGGPMYNINDTSLDIKGSYFPDEVLHFRNITTNGVWGKSPIDVARESIGLGLAAERFGAQFFGKGGNLKGVLETQGQLGDTDFKKFRRRWQEFYTGPSGDFEVPILEYGMTYKPLGVPPEAAQFVATRQFQLQDIARWFNVPPHLLADLSRATFTNIEHADLQFVKYTLRAILKRRETEIETKLLSPEEYGKIRIRYNIDGLLRGDLASLTAHLKDMVVIGVLTRNEARGLLNRNPLPGLDEPLNPANIIGKQQINANNNE